jgi:hypothetical protein
MQYRLLRLFITVFVIAIFAATIAFAMMKWDVDDFVGTWEMEHDGWKGTLILKEYDGDCDTSPPMRGTYIAHDGKKYEVDAWARCPGISRQKKWPHYVMFTIKFSPDHHQRFEGYLYSRNKNMMAGITDYKGTNYGFHAKKVQIK